MPVIETRSEQARSHRGLHLYHYGMSSCSQRVRTVLAEKGLAWTSHVVDLSREEHASEEYQLVNSKGLVPTLVHDGRTVVESIDIIRYLDEHFPAPSLTLEQGRSKDLDALLDMADRSQAALKTLTHEFLFRSKMKPTANEVEEFAHAHHNAWLVEFRRAYTANGETWRSWVRTALADMDGYFASLDAVLALQPWLTGGAFGLVDVAWMVNVHRMWLMDWPLERYPNLITWHEVIQERASFAEALVAHEPLGLRTDFAAYNEIRRGSGTSVRDMLDTPPDGGQVLITASTSAAPMDGS